MLCHAKESGSGPGVTHFNTVEPWKSQRQNHGLVLGYPQARRTLAHTGLAMPLNMMARMVKAQRIAQFGATWYFEGFSSMLALVERKHDTFLWHHIYRPNGSHIPYFNSQTANFTTNVASNSPIGSSHHSGCWGIGCRNVWYRIACPGNLARRTLAREDAPFADCPH
ncbi:hypothetical protein B0T25DRAFT_598211 [Lasiosphaeria hispida]|uniref:Uncharacterized protein n=1 Tax=Lasiosphaeria hispida TaxID=260671 RepID=A0AAJ0HWN7_9PEZI|nr:hypothetical protein B0T25DRAFT_598211 [Lasiosphaeria hispida]